MGCDFPPSLAQTKDARGIYASSSNASLSSVTFVFLQPACALILSINGNVLHWCAWVTKKSVYAWPCNWPYTHAWNAGNMLCKNWVLGNQSQGLVVVEACLLWILLLWVTHVRTSMTKSTWKCSFLIYLIQFLLLIENLRKIWLESPSIYPCLMLLLEMSTSW